ncbi:regulator of g protein [Ceratocystis lukuohia]|uniref:RGS domain-containing protein n=3 Tax=Ceratocystis TaxID=5157 RepID=A0A0F8B7F2_CERFI|nr:hypothetical protein CFO_g798 [Ceratocystis platani]PHH53882.1 hypothetical protein CFIMG_002753RA [Ceratocystis fimbriata CBS 114723]
MFFVRLPDWMSWYQRPDYKDIRLYSKAIGEGERSPSPDMRSKNTVPPNLRLERVLDNKTCSPMSLYDFYMYLKYVEHSPENLEFYIWYKNYESKHSRSRPSSMKASIAPSDISLHELGEGMGMSPSESDGTICPEDEETDAAYTVDAEVANVTREQIADLIGRQAMCGPGSCTPSFADRLKDAVRGIMPQNEKTEGQSGNKNTLNIINPSTRGARAELNAVINLFLLPGADKELNIPPAMRDRALASLQHSTDPVHLAGIADHVYMLLRNCSHRNFIRKGMGNGTLETLCSSILLGVVLTALAFLVLFMRAFTPHRGAHSMFEAFAPWPLWCFGMSFLLAGMRGSCFFLLMLSRRQALPWERFDDSASITSNKSSLMKRVSRHMIFDRKLRVKDQGMRQLQQRIIVQSVLGGSIFASICVLIFIFLPIWKQTV